MDKFNEKSAIYEQMKLLSEERSEITRAYFELKERLIRLDTACEIKGTVTNMAERKDNHTLSKEIEYQKYMIDKKQNTSSFLPYSIISLNIASILKEAGRPLSNKEFFTIATETNQLTISYENLTHNILPRMNKDSTVNVERTYRGYWQYRLD